MPCPRRSVTGEPTAPECKNCGKLMSEHGRMAECWPVTEEPTALHIKAEMVRAQLAPHQLLPWYEPEHGRIDPLTEADTQREVRRFLDWLWCYL